MKPISSPIFWVVYLLLLGACSPLSQLKRAMPNSEKAVRTALYFGQQRANGQAIAQAEWDAFVAREVSPRFPQGLSIFRAEGQWLMEDGRLAREGSYMLVLLHPPVETDFARIDTIARRYCDQFEQEAVMQVSQPVRLQFQP